MNKAAVFVVTVGGDGGASVSCGRREKLQRCGPDM